MADSPKPRAFADAAGMSVPYASEILSGKRTPSLRLAIDIYLRTGRRFGPIADAADADIDVLDRITPPSKRPARAPRSAAA